MDMPAKSVIAREDGVVSLSTLRPGAVAVVVTVGGGNGAISPVERRLLELGFNHGERIEVLAEAMPGQDPFVVRIGCTTLALRRREAQTIWVEIPCNSGF